MTCPVKPPPTVSVWPFGPVTVPPLVTPHPEMVMVGCAVWMVNGSDPGVGVEPHADVVNVPVPVHVDGVALNVIPSASHG